jgi:hypothetical protein
MAAAANPNFTLIINAAPALGPPGLDLFARPSVKW